MYFIGAAVPAPPQVFDPKWYGSLPRADERQRVANMHADGKFGRLPLVINHGLHRQPHVPEEERIGWVLWLFVDEHSRIMAVGHVEDTRPEMSALLSSLRAAQRWGLSFLTMLHEDLDNFAVRDLWYSHLGVTLNPDGGDSTRIQQFGNQIEGLRRVLRDSYASDSRIYMPWQMRAWLKDSEARDVDMYTTHGGLGPRHRNTTFPPSFVIAMADASAAAVPAPAAAVATPTTTPSAPAAASSPLPAAGLSPSDIAVQRNNELEALAKLLPQIAQTESVVTRRAELDKLAKLVGQLNREGVITGGDLLEHPTIQTMFHDRRNATRETEEMAEKYVQSKVTKQKLDDKQTEDWRAKMRRALNNPLGEQSWVLAEAEAHVRTQSEYDKAMAAEKKLHDDALTDLRREVAELKAAKATPAALTTPAAMHTGVSGTIPSTIQQQLNKATVDTIRSVAADAGTSGTTGAESLIAGYYKLMVGQMPSTGEYNMVTKIGGYAEKRADGVIPGEQMSFGHDTVTGDMLKSFVGSR